MYAPWEPVIMMYTYTLYIIIYMYLKDTDTWGVPLPCRFFSRLRACSPAFYMGLLIEDRRSVHLYEVLDIKWEAIWTPKRLKKETIMCKVHQIHHINITSKRLQSMNQTLDLERWVDFIQQIRCPSACHGGMAPRSASKRRVRGGGSATDYRGCVTFSSICSLGSLVMRLFCI